jgi:hypothetical protein
LERDVSLPTGEVFTIAERTACKKPTSSFIPLAKSLAEAKANALPSSTTVD